MRQGDAPVVCEIGKKEFDVINIMRQRDCDPISFPRRKEIVSPVKESTPKGDCDVPPLETPFVSAAVRGPRPPCRVNPQGDGRRKIESVWGGVPAGQTSRRPEDNRSTYGGERRGDPCGRPLFYSASDLALRLFIRRLLLPLPPQIQALP
jgi:hypothetical protein